VVNDLGFGFGSGLEALLLKLLTQLLEILNDAVVDDGNLVGRMRMRVRFVRLAVGRPAGMANTGVAGERFADQPLFQVLELAFGAAAREMPVFERSHTR